MSEPAHLGTGRLPAVVLDTNGILLPFTEGTDVEGELTGLVGAHTLHLPSSVLGELKQLAQGKGATGRAAKMALRFAARCVPEPTGLMGDDGILEVARRLGAAVLTNDRRLQSECVRSGLQVIVGREKGRLAWRGAASS